MWTRSLARHFTRHTLRPRLYCTPAATITPEAITSTESILATRIDKKDQQSLCNNLILLAKINTQPDEIRTLEADPRFKKLLKGLETDMRKCNPKALISCLKALKILEVDNNSPAVKHLENALLWLFRTSPIKDVVMGFSFAASREETEAQKILLREITLCLERRWVELKDGKVFISLLLHLNKLSPQLLAKLEDRLQDSAEEMPPTDLVNILVMYGKLGRRNMPVLRSLGFHIAKNRSLLDIKELSDVLFAFNKLSFKEQDTLERLCSALEPLLETNHNSAVLRSILTSLGQLKFAPSLVLDMICDSFHKGQKEGREVEMRDITTLLLTLARLNYSPPDSLDFLKELSSRLVVTRFDNSAREKQLWVDVVWSLVVLKLATADQISSVLEPSFRKSILESEDGVVSNAAIKLLNINGAATLLIKDYKGPSLNVEENLQLLDILPSQSVQKAKMKKFVFETLSTLFPPPRFVNENVPTGLGLSLDAEVVVDANAKPLQTEFYVNRIGDGKTPKALPLGANKIAIFITPFQDSLISGGMTGSTSLQVKLAKASGYLPLVIDHTTIDATMKTVSRVQKLDVLLKQLIGSAVKTG